MRRTEMKKCRKCGKPYLWTSGGIVATPQDFSDRGMCTSCRIKGSIKSIKNIYDRFSK